MLGKYSRSMPDREPNLRSMLYGLREQVARLIEIVAGVEQPIYRHRKLSSVVKFVRLPAVADLSYFGWEGTTKVVPKDGGAFDLTGSGTFTWLGGTGKYQKLSGSGTYAGNVAPSDL